MRDFAPADGKLSCKIAFGSENTTFSALPISYNESMNKPNARLYLLSLGFSPTSRGYRYLLDLTELQRRNSILPLKYNGYRILAEQYHTTPCCIDKDIQNSIGRAWLTAPPELLYREFGATVDAHKGKPTVKQFLLHMYERTET